MPLKWGAQSTVRNTSNSLKAATEHGPEQQTRDEKEDRKREGRVLLDDLGFISADGRLLKFIHSDGVIKCCWYHRFWE